MQKTFLTLSLVLGLAASAQAQRGNGNLSLGLKAGGTLSSFAGADAGTAKNLFGFQAGGFANISLSDLFAFQPEVLYSQKGAKVPALLGGDITRRFHYIDAAPGFSPQHGRLVL